MRQHFFSFLFTLASVQVFENGGVGSATTDHLA
jgi:hypothetical protein